MTYGPAIDPPEQRIPPSIEDYIGTTWVCYDEDGDLCLYGEVTGWGESYDEEYEFGTCGAVVKSGGYTLTMETYAPDGVRLRAWDQTIEYPSDLYEGTTEYEWKPLDVASFRAALESAKNA